MARYGRDYSGRHGYNPRHGWGPRGDYGVSNYGRWNRGGEHEGGWGMEGLYQHVRYGEEYRNRGGNPYLRGRGGYGSEYGGYGNDTGWRERGWGGLYNRANRGGYTGMESNRQRGVYGSDFRVRGGYDAGYTRGGPGWRGGGMNPGRRGPYDGDWF
jgi:hypothetical protein